MKTNKPLAVRLTTALLLIAGLTASGGLMRAGAKPQKAASEKESIAWQSSLTAAKSEAKRSGKPVFALFHAHWCEACKMLQEKTLTDSRVREELKKWVPVRIDVDKDEVAAATYRVESLPTLIFIKPTGERGFKFEGAVEPDDMLKLLKDAYAKARK